MSDEQEPLCAVPAVGEIVAAEIDGEPVVVWTGTGGICVMAGRCPHQWSPLDIDGLVAGDEIICTTHGWRFDREGRGTKRNVLGRRDPKADIEVVDHRVIDGKVFVEGGGTGRS